MDRAEQVADAEHAYIRAILVVKDGRTISERYLHGTDAESPQDVKSLTKSVISALIGVAIEEGFIDGVDQRVALLLPEYFEPASLPENYYGDFLADRERVQSYKEQLTVRHLMTMTAGIDDFQNTFSFGYGHVDDVAEAYLELPFASPPGERFQYSTAGAHVLSHIIERTTGASTRDFAQQYLFGPLEIDIADWKVGPRGHALGGTGLYLKARDLARFGQLYLDNGLLDGRQIFPDGWVAESLNEHAQVYPPAYISYGYLWWRRVGNPEAEDYFFASGTGGQFIFLLPEHDLVVVVSSDPNVAAEESNARSEAVQEFAEAYLLFPLAGVD